MDKVENRLNLDYFMAFSNIIKELKYLGLYDPYEVWKNYCDYIENSEEYRENPDFYQGFKKISGLGLEKIQQIYANQGLALVFIHYGVYRYAFKTILESVVKVRPDNLVLLVVDQESYNSEQQLKKWLKVYDELNIQMVIAENQSTGLRIAHHLKKGGIVVLFLDGMTGSGNDKTPLHLPFISSTINLRSGFFRLLHKLETPIIGAITPTENELLISLPIMPNDIFISASSLMSFFRQILIKDPSKWRLWYRHHLFTHSFPEIMEIPNFMNQSRVWVCDEVNPKIILSEATGNVFKYMEND